MLTQYDEFPVHQSPHPFSFIPNSDPSWSDGMYYAVYDRQGEYIFYTWLRVYPNTDIVDGFAGLLFEGGRHYSLRLSRQWRPQCDTVIGPLSYAFQKPLREIRLVLEENDHDLSCDLTWIGIAPPYQELHHKSVHWGRVTTDQTRYTQNGTARGWFEFRGKRIEVDPSNWWACRDHSWGIYSLWSPFGQNFSLVKKWFPPREQQEKERALRMWIPVCFEDHSAFYCWHESRDAEIVDMNDVFGTPFEGRIDFGWGEERPPIKLVDVSHELEFVKGSRMLKSGKLQLRDEKGREREHSFQVIGSPLAPQIGAWKDGRPNGQYRGALVMEDEELDFRSQPMERTLPNGKKIKSFHGTEYIARFTEKSEEGEAEGWGHVEFLLMGPYARYGFDK